MTKTQRSTLSMTIPIGSVTKWILENRDETEIQSICHFIIETGTNEEQTKACSLSSLPNTFAGRCTESRQLCTFRSSPQ